MNFKYALLPFICTVSLNAFSTTNISYLYGGFNDNSYVYDTKNGGKSTFTLEHYSAFEYGDIFAFADYAIADERFKYQNTKNDLYYEISPRINLSKIANIDLSNSFIKDFYAAFQYNKGEEYKAYLSGVGVDLDMPFFDVFGVNIYDKNQNIGDHTIQLSLNYFKSSMFGSEFDFNGFADWTEDDFLTQNQLLYDLSSIASLKQKSLFGGVEWHYYRVKSTDILSNSMQAMIKYVW